MDELLECAASCSAGMAFFPSVASRPDAADATPYCLSPKQIAQSLLLSGAGLTSRLNKLEAQNYLARLPEPDDRRTLRIQLTAAGEAVINEAIPRVFEVQRSRLLPLGADSQRRLVEELTRFADIIDSWPSVPVA